MSLLDNSTEKLHASILNDFNFGLAQWRNALWSNGTKQTDSSVTVQPRPILNDTLYLYLMFIILGVICQTVAVFGLINNVINIIVFFKQGFLDSINVSLTALAISDMCSLISIMWSNLCFSPALRDADIPMITTEVHLITGGWSHVTFTRTTGMITAFISLERCICVVRPLKVRTIFTPRRHLVVMVTFFIATIGSASLAYLSVGLGWRFFPERNKTLIGLIFHMDANRRRIADSVSFAVNGVLILVSCFFSVVAFMGVLVVKLNKKAAWRNSNSSSMSGLPHKSYTHKGVNTKEMKVAKMVVTISVIFIACFIPAVGTFIAGYLEPQLTYDGLYKNLFLVTLSVSFTTEAINSSINIFVYFIMSSKYRRTLVSLFGKIKCIIF